MSSGIIDTIKKEISSLEDDVIEQKKYNQCSIVHDYPLNLKEKDDLFGDEDK
jgi:hypothetical protein